MAVCLRKDKALQGPVPLANASAKTGEETAWNAASPASAIVGTEV
jgi:hypothetical protein